MHKLLHFSHLSHRRNLTLLPLLILTLIAFIAILYITGQKKFSLIPQAQTDNQINVSSRPIINKKSILEFSNNEILIKLRPKEKTKLNQLASPVNTGIATLDGLNRSYGIRQIAQTVKPMSSSDQTADIFRWYTLTLPAEQKIVTADSAEGQKLYKIIEEYKKIDAVEEAELNGTMYADNTPNDPFYATHGLWDQDFDDLWGLKAIDMDHAWDISVGSKNIVVADIDTGVDYTHEDIAGNLWQNPGEIPDNGIDDDHNGYIDDYNGWNFYDDTKDIMDTDGHGTHTAGTIAAVGNNGIGVVGMN